MAQSQVDHRQTIDAGSLSPCSNASILTFRQHHDTEV